MKSSGECRWRSKDFSGLSLDTPTFTGLYDEDELAGNTEKHGMKQEEDQNRTVYICVYFFL